MLGNGLQVDFCAIVHDEIDDLDCCCVDVVNQCLRLAVQYRETKKRGERGNEPKCSAVHGF